jgi:hypothetical protein
MPSHIYVINEAKPTVPPSPHLPKQSAGKRKANELTSSGCSMEPAIRRPAPGPLSGAGSAPLPVIAAAGTSPEGAASMCAQNPGSTEMKATYAAVTSGSPFPLSIQVGRSWPQQKRIYNPRYIHHSTYQSRLPVSAKPTSLLARAARWSLQEGAQRPGHCPELGPRLCLSLLPREPPRKVQHRCVPKILSLPRWRRSTLLWPPTLPSFFPSKWAAHAHSRFTFINCDYATLVSNRRKSSNQSMPSHIFVVNKVKSPVFPSVVLN